jgi:cardiolipin synthase A/B
MPRLLEKILGFRHHRQRAKPQRREASKPSKSPWFWPGMVGIAIVIFGLYFWLTSARILVEPIEVTFGPRDPPFTSAMGPVVKAEFTTGNRVETLVNGDQFFPAMLDAIRSAQRTITLETYIWTSGSISDRFIDALSERAGKGVKVHVIIDGMGTLKFKQADRQRLRDSGVHLVTYGREHWYEIKPNINHRTHRKILVIDGAVGFTGGMCIDDRWLGDADHEKLWRETQIRVDGPVVRQMQAVFASNWLQTTGALLLGEGYFPEPVRAGAKLAHCFMSGPGENPQSTRLAHMFAIAAARESIDIAQAYFVPDNLAISMLVAARERGVRVRVIVPAINDSRFGRAVSRSRWGRLLAAGVEFHRYEPAMYHVKSMVVDDILVILGSANFDNRSFAINDEITVGVLDPAVAAEHRRIFEKDLAKSSPLTLEEFEARPLYIKISDHFAGLFRSQF